MSYYIKKYPFSCLLAVTIWIVCLIPVPETPLNEINFIDKWTHFVMYGTFTIVIWREYHRNHTDSRNGKRLVTYGIVCPIIMGILIELAQAYLTTCRSGDWFDAVCNSIGVLLGSLAGYLIWRKRR